MINKVYSIRRFLLIYLLITMVLTTLATSIGNFYLDQRDIENHLDNLLQQSLHTFRSVLGNNQFIIHNLQELQNNIDQNSQNHSLESDTAFYAKRILPHYEFQIYDVKGELLLHSNSAPASPLSDKNFGFSLKEINHHQWRSYVEIDNINGLKIIVGEKHDLRKKLTENILFDDINILLLTYPIAGFLIWFIVGYGFKSVKRVTDELKQRLPSYLEPLNTQEIPEEIKPLVLELNRLLQRLKQAFEREKRFAADAAHELKTPLAALKTQSQVALKSTDDTERSAILQNVILGVDRMSRIVQQLLTLSRLHHDISFFEEQLVRVDLTKLASETIAYLVPQALNKNIELELKASPDCLIDGEPTAIGILIRNLIDNAIRYTFENTTIKVIVTTKIHHVVLKIIDQGPGIPTELKNRVFERFYRVLGTQSSGSGLGLAIVEQIARLHQAKIFLDKPPSGSGLEVQVWFPTHYQKRFL